MNPCPSDLELASLLDDGLAGADLATVEAHLEACTRCQQVLEELTYQRFSGAEWRDPASSCPEPPALAVAPADGSLVHSGLLVEQDSRRKRLILGAASRSPSSYRIAPDERAEAAARGEDGAAAYPPEVDGYDILGRLGRGGMGVVYRARQHGLDRLVALKMLRGGGHADAESLARFRIEVRSVARLDHPNVVRVFDVGESRGLPYVALELLEGGSLEARIGGVPQPEAVGAGVGARLARAIAAAHRAGIVHRDLKSANVLFSRDGEPKITDFGLAKRLDEDDGQTQSGQVMGSPSFMAPEQARGVAAIGPRADIYSLGAILYELLAGRPPFRGGSALETLHQVVHAEPVAPSRLRPALARDLETICLKCLSKEPTHRYPTADRLADDLDRFLLGAPIEARRIHRLERAWKWARREPARAALAAAAGLAVIAGLGAGWSEAERSQARAAHMAELRLVIPPMFREIEERTAAGEWPAARARLRELPDDLGSHPELGDFQERAAELGEAIGRAEAERAAGIASGEKRDRFLALVRQARLADAQRLLTGGLASGDPLPVRAAAVAALGWVGRVEAGSPGHPGAWRRTEAFARLEDAGRVEVDLACREMVLLRAEAIGRPAPGEDPATQARAALASLEEGDGVRPAARAILLLSCRLAERAGESTRAADSRRRAAAAAPSDALDQVAVGRDHQDQGRWDRAIPEYQAALRADPSLFLAQLGLATCQLQADRPEAAQVGLTACLQHHPRSIDLLILRGLAAGRSAQAAAPPPDRAGGRPAGGKGKGEGEGGADPFAAAEEDFAAAERLGPSEGQRAALLMDRGLVRFAAARYRDAAADFDALIRLDPTHLAAHVNLGQALLRAGQVDGAVAAFDRAIELSPRLPRLYRERAVARLARRGPADPGEVDLAIRDLDEAIRLAPADSPDLAVFHAQRARLHHRERDFEPALADSDRALRLDPDAVDPMLVRIQTLLELKRSAEVVEACDAALARRPDLVDPWELRGVARAARRDFGGAIGDFAHALGLAPDRTTARLQRGWCYLYSEAARLAIDDFQAVLDRDPAHAEALGGRGSAFVAVGRYQDAVADAEESARLEPANPRIVYNAARVYAQAAGPNGRAAARGQALAPAAEYQDRAMELVRAAIEALPPGRRAEFWRTTVQVDPAFAAIRRHASFAHLAGLAGTTSRTPPPAARLQEGAAPR